MNKIYKKNIEKQTIKNKYYRKVVSTTKNLQVVLMNLKPDEQIGNERHRNTTQFIRIESGNGIVKIKNKKYKIKDGDAVVIPPNIFHNIINTGKKELKLYTIYSPPEHPETTKILHKQI